MNATKDENTIEYPRHISSYMKKRLSKLRMSAECVIQDGKLRLVLYRNKPTDKTRTCLFCGSHHVHGSECDGHRYVHCTGSQQNITFKNSKGEQFCSKDGYVIKSLK